MVIFLSKQKHFSLTTRYVILVGVLLLAANIMLGIVLVNQSKNAMQTMIRKSMLDISNSAAGLLDGDVMGALTEDDVGTPVFEEIRQKLYVFQERVDIEFIYAVRQVGEDSFVFTVDADPVDPGQFGEEVLVTYALREAAKGRPTVDDAPASDRWGNFYSAYSPIFDSSGKVSGIVGVDFSAEWYEAAVRQHMFSIGIISVLSVAIGAFVMVLITRKVRIRFHELDEELSALSRNVDALTEEILSNPDYRARIPAAEPAPEPAADSGDELEALGGKIRSMQHELERYLDFVHAQAYTDSLTGVGNPNAYQERLRIIKSEIEAGTAAFSAAVFDIDNLKIVNDRYGHTCGDKIICGAASAIASVFGRAGSYRIGGDEFIVISDNCRESDALSKLDEIKAAVDRFNAAPDHPEATLSLAMGATAFRPGEDHSFRDVFVRADEIMYDDKGQHHRRAPNLAERQDRMHG